MWIWLAVEICVSTSVRVLVCVISRNLYEFAYRSARAIIRAPRPCRARAFHSCLTSKKTWARHRQCLAQKERSARSEHHPYPWVSFSLLSFHLKLSFPLSTLGDESGQDFLFQNRLYPSICFRPVGWMRTRIW